MKDYKKFSVNPNDDKYKFKEELNMPKLGEYGDISTIKNLKNQSGVYEISLAESPSERQIINRFREKDKKGRLYIGKSVDLKRRIKEFYHSCEYPDEKHNSGLKLAIYNIVFTPGKQAVKVADIQYRYAVEEDESKIQKMEAKLLAEYFREFGELPPLNSNMPDGFLKEIEEFIKVNPVTNN